MKNKLFGFTHQYPQKFLDELAKILGVEWTPAPVYTFLATDISICPIDPPSATLYYVDFKYDNKQANIDTI